MASLVKTYDKMQFAFLVEKQKVMQEQLRLINVLKTDIGFYNAVKCYVNKGFHPIVAYEEVNSFFKTILGCFRYKSFEEFEISIKKLGHVHPSDFYKV